MPDSRHIDWVLLDPARGQGASVGDLISSDAGGMPVYQLVGLKDRTAVVRDPRGGAEQTMPLGRFRWKIAS